MGWGCCQGLKDAANRQGRETKGGPSRFACDVPVTHTIPAFSAFKSIPVLIHMVGLISAKNLTFVPQGALEPALDNISLSLPKGSRTLLIGANGGQSLSFSQSLATQNLLPARITAGKSTLLQILAGKKLIKDADVTIRGLDVFYQFPEGVTFLGTEWSVRVRPSDAT